MPSSDKRLLRLLQNSHAVVLLAFIGGYVDAAGYIHLSGLFTSSITGNLVVACIGIAESPQESLTRILVCISFFLAACLNTFMAIRLKYTPNVSPHLRGICTFLIEIFFLLLTMVLGLVIESYGYDIRSHTLSNWTVILLGCTLGAAMGAHNAAAQEIIDDCPSTTVMTMTLVKNAMYLARTTSYFLATKAILPIRDSSKLHQQGSDDAAQYVLEQYHLHLGRLSVAVRPLFSFILGAVIGAIFMLGAGLWSFSLPLAIVAVLIVDIYLGHLAAERDDPCRESELSSQKQAITSPLAGYTERATGNGEEKAHEAPKSV